MIKKQQDQLFDRWQTERGYPFFVRDGVFDEDTWEAEPLKITFILKEANWQNENVPLCEWVLNQESNPWKTWNNVARWTKALLEGGEYPRYVSREERTRLLKRVSFLNLKKTGGGRGANPKKVRQAARDDAEYIREQLLLYKPDLIVCCGKWLVADVLQKEVLQRPDLPGPFLPAQDWENWDGFPCFYTRFPGKERLTPVASFYHPEWFTGGHGQWQIFFEQMKEARAVLLPPQLP